VLVLVEGDSVMREQISSVREGVGHFTVFDWDNLYKQDICVQSL
jgi:hypothetical protein